MRYESEICELLDQLDEVEADALEAQDLDFKEWNPRSLNDSVNLAVEMAVCMANGGGGTVVWGVRDRVVGRENAILGVPDEVDVNRLKRSIYERTDPKITPGFQEVEVAEGSGRLLIMQIHEGMPPYTDTSGSAKIRIGKDCMPLTGSTRRRLGAELGDSDVSASPIEGDWRNMISESAIERLRSIASKEAFQGNILRSLMKICS